MARVKCFYCGEYFDREVEPFEMPRANRYAHKKCYEKNFTEEDACIEKIHYLMAEHVGEYDYNAVQRQRAYFISKYGFTNQGIYKTLLYYFTIQKGDRKKANGRIGIVPYVYEDAKNYFAKFDKKQKEVTEELEKQLFKKAVVLEVYRENRKVQRKVFDLDDIGRSD